MRKTIGKILFWMGILAGFWLFNFCIMAGAPLHVAVTFSTTVTMIFGLVAIGAYLQGMLD